MALKIGRERKAGEENREGKKDGQLQVECESNAGSRLKRECLHSRSPDYTKGIFQSIGFKEFHAYLTLPEEERASEKVS